MFIRVWAVLKTLLLLWVTVRVALCRAILTSDDQTCVRFSVRGDKQEGDQKQRWMLEKLLFPFIVYPIHPLSFHSLFHPFFILAFFIPFILYPCIHYPIHSLSLHFLILSFFILAFFILFILYLCILYSIHPFSLLEPPPSVFCVLLISTCWEQATDDYTMAPWVLACISMDFLAKMKCLILFCVLFPLVKECWCSNHFMVSDKNM